MAAEQQVFNYLESPRVDVEMINDFLLVQSVLTKLNTPLPSSAAVERLFSFVGMLLAPKRRCMTDQTFEQRLLITCNRLV